MTKQRPNDSIIEIIKTAIATVIYASLYFEEESYTVELPGWFD